MIGKPEEYTFIKFVILALAIMLLVALLVLTLGRGRRTAVDEPSPTPTPSATREPTEVAVVAASDTPTLTVTTRPTNTPRPTATATDVPPTATNTPRPSTTATHVPPTTVTEVAEVATTTATNTPRPPTATHVPPSPTPTQEPPTAAPMEAVEPQITSPASGASVPAGRLEIFGVSEANMPLQVVEGGEVLGTTVSDGSGGWGVVLGEGLEAGTHTLRAEALDASGKVVARSGSVSFDVLETVVETTGSDHLPWPVFLSVAGALLALGVVFVLAGVTLRAWERTRRY